MYKMKIRLAVDVEITAKDAPEAFEKLALVKHHLKIHQPLAGKIRDVNTNAMLSEEETYND